MSRAKWEEYRHNIKDAETNWVYSVSSSVYKMLVDYIKSRIDIDGLDKLLAFKDDFVERYADEIEIVNVRELTTSQFVNFIIGIKALMMSRFNLGKKPFPVFLKQDEELIDDLLDIFTDYYAMYHYVNDNRDAIYKMRETFAPSGTGRFDDRRYLYYLLASDQLAKATGEIMSVDLAEA